MNNVPTNDELEYLRSIRGKRNYGSGDRNEMYRVYNRIFNDRKTPTSCGSCVAKTHRALMAILEKYGK